jgi:flagellar hook-length control protein FliK
VTLSEPPSASAAKTANNALPANATADIGQQITESIQGSLRPGDRQITILLHPPELGKVVVRFKEEQDQVTGLLEVSKAETRYEIEQVLPQIVRSLQDLGVQVRRLEVQLSEQMERQANRDASPDDGSLHQQSPGEGGNSDNGATYEWLLNTFGQAYRDDFEAQWPLSEQSINMLM